MVSTKFIEGIGGKLAERWVATLLTPAFCFWAGGLLAWVQRFGWASLQTWLGQLSDPLQITVLVLSLLTIAASAFAIQRFDLPVLRFLEGYWPRPLRRLWRWSRKGLRQQLCLPVLRFLEGYWPRSLHGLRRWLLKQQRSQPHRLKQDLQDLMRQSADRPLTLDELECQAWFNYQLHWLPPQPEFLMPTSLGNSLRAAELRPQNKYGLNAVVCWPHLWLLLPDAARNELQEARANLNTAARVWLWGVLFIIWTPLSAWALPISLCVVWFAYRWALLAARSYGDLLDAAFDLYRHQLYRALRVPLPRNSEEEKKAGQLLSENLWRGPVHPITYLNS